LLRGHHRPSARRHPAGSSVTAIKDVVIPSHRQRSQTPSPLSQEVQSSLSSREALSGRLLLFNRLSHPTPGQCLLDTTVPSTMPATPVLPLNSSTATSIRMPHSPSAPMPFALLITPSHSPQQQNFAGYQQGHSSSGNGYQYQQSSSQSYNGYQQVCIGIMLWLGALLFADLKP
jgi:hypothetical protein